MKAKPNVVINSAVEEDFAQIQQIYAHYIRTSTISLEETPPQVEEMIARRNNSIAKGLPYLVAKIDGEVVGYAYAFQYRPRSAYRFTVEESVYVSKDHQGFGIGYKLLLSLMEECKQKGYRQMLAVIAGSDNITSIKFHENLGFTQSGVLRKFGFKFNQWIDTVLMQKEL